MKEMSNQSERPADKNNNSNNKSSSSMNRRKLVSQSSHAVAVAGMNSSSSGAKKPTTIATQKSHKRRSSEGNLRTNNSNNSSSSNAKGAALGSKTDHIDTSATTATATATATATSTSTAKPRRSSRERTRKQQQTLGEPSTPRKTSRERATKKNTSPLTSKSSRHRKPSRKRPVSESPRASYSKPSLLSNQRKILSQANLYSKSLSEDDSNNNNNNSISSKQRREKATSSTKKHSSTRKKDDTTNTTMDGSSTGKERRTKTRRDAAESMDGSSKKRQPTTSRRRGEEDGMDSSSKKHHRSGRNTKTTTTSGRRRNPNKPSESTLNDNTTPKAKTNTETTTEVATVTTGESQTQTQIQTQSQLGSQSPSQSQSHYAQSPHSRSDSNSPNEQQQQYHHEDHQGRLTRRMEQRQRLISQQQRLEHQRMELLQRELQEQARQLQLRKQESEAQYLHNNHHKDKAKSSIMPAILKQAIMAGASKFQLKKKDKEEKLPKDEKQPKDEKLPKDEKQPPKGGGGGVFKAAMSLGLSSIHAPNSQKKKPTIPPQDTTNGETATTNTTENDTTTQVTTTTAEIEPHLVRTGTMKTLIRSESNPQSDSGGSPKQKESGENDTASASAAQELDIFDAMEKPSMSLPLPPKRSLLRAPSAQSHAISDQTSGGAKSSSSRSPSPNSVNSRRRRKMGMMKQLSAPSLNTSVDYHVQQKEALRADLQANEEQGDEEESVFSAMSMPDSNFMSKQQPGVSPQQKRGSLDKFLKVKTNHITVENFVPASIQDLVQWSARNGPKWLPHWKQPQQQQQQQQKEGEQLTILDESQNSMLDDSSRRKDHMVDTKQTTQSSAESKDDKRRFSAMPPNAGAVTAPENTGRRRPYSVGATRFSSIKSGVDLSDFETDRFSINSESCGVTKEAYLQLVVDTFTIPKQPRASSWILEQSFSSSLGDIQEHVVDSSDHDDESCHSMNDVEALQQRRLSKRFSKEQIEAVKRDFYTQFEKLEPTEQNELLRKIRSVSVIEPAQFDWRDSNSAMDSSINSQSSGRSGDDVGLDSALDGSATNQQARRKTYQDLGSMFHMTNLDKKKRTHSLPGNTHLANDKVKVIPQELMALVPQTAATPRIQNRGSQTQLMDQSNNSLGNETLNSSINSMASNLPLKKTGRKSALQSTADSIDDQLSEAEDLYNSVGSIGHHSGAIRESLLNKMALIADNKFGTVPKFSRGDDRNGGKGSNIIVAPFSDPANESDWSTFNRPSRMHGEAALENVAKENGKQLSGLSEIGKTSNRDGSDGTEKEEKNSDSSSEAESLNDTAHVIGADQGFFEKANNYRVVLDVDNTHGGDDISSSEADTINDTAHVMAAGEGGSSGGTNDRDNDSFSEIAPSSSRILPMQSPATIRLSSSRHNRTLNDLMPTLASGSKDPSGISPSEYEMTGFDSDDEREKVESGGISMAVPPSAEKRKSSKEQAHLNKELHGFEGAERRVNSNHRLRPSSGQQHDNDSDMYNGHAAATAREHVDLSYGRHSSDDPNFSPVGRDVVVLKDDGARFGGGDAPDGSNNTRASSFLDREMHGPFPLFRPHDVQPLYSKPDLRDLNRHQRRQDISRMGGVPSFYDDHLYECFDFIPKTSSCLPRMTEDDEHDDYHLTSTLCYRQWVGMPTFQSDTESDDDYDHDYDEDDDDDGYY